MKKKVSIWMIPLAVVVSVALTIGAFCWGLSAFTNHNAAALARLLYVQFRIHSGFVGDPFTNRQLFDGAMKGMVSSLNDPYSEYLDAKAFSSMSQVTNGTFGGIGVVLGQKGKDHVVIAPQEGSPGARAGIKAGDKILSVDDQDVRNLSLEEVVSRVRGEKGTHVKITLQRKDSDKTYTVDIVRDDIKIESVAGRLLPGTQIGYIRIAVFNEQTGADFAKRTGSWSRKACRPRCSTCGRTPAGS